MKIYNKLCIVILMSNLLLGCSSINDSKTPRLTSNLSAVNFIYSPNGAEEFIFTERAFSNQDSRYDSVCHKIPENLVTTAYACLNEGLDYHDYVGVRGFYTGVNTKSGYSNYYLREVILETGEKFYLITHITPGSNLSEVKPYAEHLARKNFKAYPIVSNSSILVRRHDEKDINFFLVGKNPARILSSQEISNIQNVASMNMDRQAEIADALFGLDIKKDDFDESFTITRRYDSLDQTGITLVIKLKSQGNLEAWLRASYSSESWLFVDRFSVKTNGSLWESGIIQFSRDNYGGRVWEWADLSLTYKVRDLLAQLYRSEESVVRFFGKSYRADLALTKKHKEELINLIFVLNALSPKPLIEM